MQVHSVSNINSQEKKERDGSIVLSGKLKIFFLPL